MKGIGLSFDSTNSDIRLERLPFEQLKALKPKHSGQNPSQQEPIIILEWQGKQTLIDGNHRVNGWLAANDGRERNALVITPRPSWPHPPKS